MLQLKFLDFGNTLPTHLPEVHRTLFRDRDHKRNHRFRIFRRIAPIPVTPHAWLLDTTHIS